ncbi:uncharacterized protein LOC120465536 [Pimephales promelas]|uniref:uncharacterized protein LOC120465536 n=1 Tax=Pimephales promelas TaxID=90988 RepID=UPI0019556D75|nr:uncharacterized protein LOC120465536 [Pimephales promelas]
MVCLRPVPSVRNYPSSVCSVLFILFFILGCHQRTSCASASLHAGPRVKHKPLLETLRLPHNTEYEIVAPYEVDHQGRYISHAVAHQHRRKRSTDGQGHDPTVHFRFHGLGQDFHLDLQPSHDLMAPSFTVQTLGRSGTKSLQPFPQDDLCFYHGVLRSKVNSYVALSTCAGMFRARPRSSEMKKATLERSVGNEDGFISMYSSHCNRKPLHSPSSPEKGAGWAMGHTEADVEEVDVVAVASVDELVRGTAGGGGELAAEEDGMIWRAGWIERESWLEPRRSERNRERELMGDGPEEEASIAGDWEWEVKTGDEGR